MNDTVKELSNLAGVSVRTLHYYDEIGLLAPAAVAENGYRFYTEKEFLLLQQILFYRELSFSLSEIADILHNPQYDRTSALHNQKELLLCKKERLLGMIALIEQAIKGEEVMNMENISREKEKKLLKAYEKEAREKYKGTKEYQDYEKKSAGCTKETFAKISEEADEIFRQFAALLSKAPESEEVQALVKVWHDFINEHYYACSLEILSSLGEMYVADERFLQNLDRFGAGTAAFMRDAIRVYCRREIQ